MSSAPIVAFGFSAEEPKPLALNVNLFYKSDLVTFLKGTRKHWDSTAGSDAGSSPSSVVALMPPAVAPMAVPCVAGRYISSNAVVDWPTAS